MKTHGKLKASITVETALVLPIVLGAVFAVLFLVLVMYQNSVQLSLLNRNALQGANLAADAYTREDLSGNLIIAATRNQYGYITDPAHNYYKDYESIYSLVNIKSESPSILNSINNSIYFKTNSDLTNSHILEQSADADVSLDSGGSVIVKGNMKMPNIALFGALGTGASVGASGVASVINPSQYIRETDSKCALLAAYTTIWDGGMDQFLSDYLTELFKKGTIS